MFNIAHGNLLKADADALVNTVNTQGVMGKGIAAQFKRAYPHVFKSYQSACATGEVRLGQMHVVDMGALGGGPRWVINFPTKGHWKAKSKLTDIRAGLVDLVRVTQQLGIKSIAIPPLGCGNGGLDWAEVLPVIREALEPLQNVRVDVFAPEGAPTPSEMPTRTARPKLTLGSAALIALVDRYQGALLDPVVRLLEIHKLMYFLQEAGEARLRLQYQQGLYGPYAQNLRHLLTRIEGHWVLGYGDGGDDPSKQVELIAGAAEAADAFIADEFATQERMERVALLIDGYEDPYGLELLGTVHWVMCRNHAARDDSNAAIAAVQSWNSRKANMMKPEHVAKAWNRLRDHGWHAEARSAVH